MKILLTLDYELFLGNRTGTVENCLVKPMKLYSKAMATEDVRSTIFVDAAYIHSLQKLSASHHDLRHDFETVRQNIRSLRENGHDIQLHIHPQWYFSEYDGQEWLLDTSHYKLSDVPNEEMKRLFSESKALLDEIAGRQTSVFRAGGCSAQPTSLLAELMGDNGLTTDSSVCPGAVYDSPFQKYDYSRVGNMCAYPFDDDICTRQEGGRFMEIPISMYRVNVLFHWRLLFNRLLSRIHPQEQHRLYGDGQSIPASRADIFRRLLHSCDTLATIDGYKISFLKAAIDSHAEKGDELMCVIGHPKLATPYSVRQIRDICAYAKSKGHTFATFSELV